MNRQYEKLEGREVKALHTAYGDVNCIVTGSDWNIGITIQEASTKNYILCLHNKGRRGSRFSKKLMATIYDLIMKKGEIDTDNLIILGRKCGRLLGTWPGAKNCPFSQ